MCAPEQQAFVKEGGGGHAASADSPDTSAGAAQLAAKEAELAALSAGLEADESALLREQQASQAWAQSTGDAPSPGVAAAALDALAARWRCLAARREVLAARWQLLVLERRVQRGE